MSGNELVENLTEKKKVLIDHAEDKVISQVGNILLGIQGRVSRKAWHRLIKIEDSLI